MAAVRAAKRVGISWLDQPAFEDTDTLVFTVNGWSLDLRVFTTGPDTGKIDWATAARVTETSNSTTSSPELKWNHLIDSRPPSDLPDQGIFQSLPNGNVTETGVMFNPKTGRNEHYVETWRRYPNQPGDQYCVLERIDHDKGGSAYLGKVGPRTLGLALSEDGVFEAYRERVEDGQVKRVFESTPRPTLPSLPETLPEDYVDGAEVELGGCRWAVRTAGRVG